VCPPPASLSGRRAHRVTTLNERTALAAADRSPPEHMPTVTDVLANVLGDNLRDLDVEVARADGRWVVRVNEPQGRNKPSLMAQPGRELVLADVSDVMTSLLSLSLPK
jgi:hypothetical protein